MKEQGDERLRSVLLGLKNHVVINHTRPLCDGSEVYLDVFVCLGRLLLCTPLLKTLMCALHFTLYTVTIRKGRFMCVFMEFQVDYI